MHLPYKSINGSGRSNRNRSSRNRSSRNRSSPYYRDDNMDNERPDPRMNRTQSINRSSPYYRDDEMDNERPVNRTTNLSKSRKFALRKKPNKNIPVKRIAVNKAYKSVRKVCEQCQIPCVKKTFGREIVRVCCRTIKQLDHIHVILQELIKFDLIKEIGMPLEYSYKMKSLVLFINPKILTERYIISKVFSKSSLRYPNLTVEVTNPEDQKQLSELKKEVSKIVKTEQRNVRFMPSFEIFLHGSWTIALIVLAMVVAIVLMRSNLISSP